MLYAHVKTQMNKKDNYNSNSKKGLSKLEEARSVCWVTNPVVLDAVAKF